MIIFSIIMVAVMVAFFLYEWHRYTKVKPIEKSISVDEPLKKLLAYDNLKRGTKWFHPHHVSGGVVSAFFAFIFGWYMGLPKGIVIAMAILGFISGYFCYRALQMSDSITSFKKNFAGGGTVG